MKIGFAGAGAVGCHYGSKLAQAGVDVVLLARGAHLQAMQRDGLLHESAGETLRVRLCATADAGALAGCDVVFFSCKMTGLALLGRQLHGMLSPDAMLWRKLLWNCGFNAITAITRRFAGEVAMDVDMRAVAQQAMQETLELAIAKGVAITPDDVAKHMAITATMGPVKTSMWQDIEAGRPLEIDYINGYVAGEAERLGLTAPVNRLLAVLVRGLAGGEVAGLMSDSLATAGR